MGKSFHDRSPLPRDLIGNESETSAAGLLSFAF
jgi:hypothetical protein